MYSEGLKTNVTWDNRLKRNIFEITLDKVDNILYDDLDQASILRLYRTLGINTETEVEGYFQRVVDSFVEPVPSTTNFHTVF